LVKENFCPQWTRDEIVTLLSLDLKVAGTVALTSIMYLIGAIIVAAYVRLSLRNYKCDYV
jgi:hypothetical protein